MRANDRCLITLILGITVLADPLAFAGEANPNVSSSARQRPASTLYTCGLTFEFARILPGEFVMGRGGGGESVHTARRIRIEYPFDIGTTEVSVKQFQAFVLATGYETDAEKRGWGWHRVFLAMKPVGWATKVGINWRYPGFPQKENHPVVSISWNDAIAFCEWLSHITGDTYRLPSEAEWEYACRAGSLGPYSGNLDEMAWYAENSEAGSHPPGRKQPNEWGIYDMQGNAWEWCGDVWHKDFEGAPTDGRPWMEDGKTEDGRPCRGGCWAMGFGSATPTNRSRFSRDDSCNNTGLRIVREVLDLQEPADRKSEARKMIANTQEDVGDVVFEFIPIPAGEFEMGSDKEYARMPRHRVEMSRGFEMGKTEVTVAQFRAFIAETGYKTDAEKTGWTWSKKGEEYWTRKKGLTWRTAEGATSDNSPVVCLSWNDGQAFCRWLSEKTRTHCRMPSEAEWEYVCTAGGSDDPDSPEYEAGKKNSWGLCNLFAEPVELCLDIWHSNFSGAPTDGSAQLTREGLSANRVVRGFKLEPQWGIGYSHRMHCVPNEPVHEQGLRVARFQEMGLVRIARNHPPNNDTVSPKPAVSLDFLGRSVEEADGSERYSMLRGFLQELILAEKLTSQQNKRHYFQAIDLARSDREKSLVIPLMRNVPCIETINTLRPFLSVPELQADAAAVILDIIPDVQGEYPDETVKVMELIEDKAANNFIRHKLQNTSDYIERNRGRVTQWLVSEPFVGGGDLFDLTFPPEDRFVDANWNIVKTNGFWGTADLARLSEINTCMFYLRASVYSPKSQEVQLQLKGDHGVKAWLNGTLAFEDRAERNFRSQPSETSAMLNEGWNHLLLKTIKKGKRCSAYCRINDLEGKKLNGLRTKAE